MRRAAAAFRAEQARSAFLFACARLLQAHGWIAMDRDGQQWAHGLVVLSTPDALVAIEEDGLAQAWRDLTGATS